MVLTYPWLFSVAATVEILTPPPQISTTSPQMHIIGRTDARKLEVYLNGKRLSDIEVDESVFHQHISFGYGLNKISIMPVSYESKESAGEGADLEVLHVPEIKKRYVRLYPEYVFHDNEPKENCIGCHRASPASLMAVADSVACLSCHVDLMERFKRHTTVDNRVCIGCHRLGSDLAAAFAPGNQAADPCYACHQDKISQFTQDYIHGPVAGGSCTICHDAHGSNWDKSLLSPTPLLCFLCHEEIDSQQDREVVHRPFAEGKCVVCHDPHSTSNKWMLQKNSEVVCMRCHEASGTLQRHEHPYNVKPDKKLTAPLRLSGQGKLECVSCHNPHAANTEHLLRTNQQHTCAGCHREKL
jgi:predicted CXXCH cytochrome family protein